MQFPRLSVLLPTYRQPEVLLLTVRDLVGQDYPKDLWDLVLLDDGSRDGSSEIALRVLSQDIPVTLRQLPRGGTYSHAQLFNELLRLASPSSSVLVHVEDVRVRSDFLRQHAKWHLTKDMFLVTGPMCEGDIETFKPSACNRWALMQMGGVTSKAYRCCFQAIFAKSMSYPGTLLQALKDSGDPEAFDTSMRGWGYHEIDFAFRAERAGATCVYDVTCAVYHPVHSRRDEIDYRGINRGDVQSVGENQNIEYLCTKYGLTRLPDWKIGEPIELPVLISDKESEKA